MAIWLYSYGIVWHRMAVYGFLATWLWHGMGVSGCMAIWLYGHGMIWLYMAVWRMAVYGYLAQDDKVTRGAR